MAVATPASESCLMAARPGVCGQDLCYYSGESLRQLFQCDTHVIFHYFKYQQRIPLKYSTIYFEV